MIIGEYQGAVNSFFINSDFNMLFSCQMEALLPTVRVCIAPDFPPSALNVTVYSGLNKALHPASSPPHTHRTIPRNAVKSAARFIPFISSSPFFAALPAANGHFHGTPSALFVRSPVRTPYPLYLLFHSLSFLTNVEQNILTVSALIHRTPEALLPATILYLRGKIHRPSALAVVELQQAFFPHDVKGFA